MSIGARCCQSIDEYASYDSYIYCISYSIEMAQLQITGTTTSNTLQLKIQYPLNPEMTYNFKMEIQIFQQILNNGNRRDALAYKNVFYTQQRNIQIKDLGFSKMYRVEVSNQYGTGQNNRKVKNIFVYTQANRDEQDQSGQQMQQSYSQPINALRPRPNSSQPSPSQQRQRQQSMKKPEIRPNSQLCNSELLIKTLAQSGHIVNKEKAHKFMLESRKCRNVKQFINEKHGKRVNPSQVGDKRMLVIQSKLLFSQVYKYREGCRFFNNSWGMGPFYSYDFNQNQIRKN